MLRFKLTTKELGELIFEAIITMGIIYFLYMGVLLLFDQIVQAPPSLLLRVPVAWELVQSLDLLFIKFRYFFFIFAAVVAILFTWWRLARRYKQIQLRHILDELHYIASGHFDHRISTEIPGDMSDVVHSINTLVESTVQAMEEERRIEQSKDELITNVSHDIRTPLTSIIGYLGLLVDNQVASIQDADRYIQVAYTKALQMKVLVDDLFEYTKVRHTATPLTLSTLNIGRFLEQIAAEFELESSRKNMDIYVEVAQDPLMIEVDVDKLARVFNNLIHNALKYGRGGTWVRIQAEKVGSEAIITVMNNGEPIPKDSLDELFNRFYRVESSRSQETGGTGLGLAIAQSIIALHGGYIYAESNEQVTKFVMHLPLKQQRDT